MRLEHKKVILISMFLLIIPVVLGANIIEQVFDSLGGNIDLGQTYLKYPALIDAIIYFILFIAISKSVFSKIDQFKDNNVVPIVIGVILAISMTVLSTQMRPPLRLLADMGPYALILFIMVIAVFLFNFVKGMGATKLFAFSITFLLLAGLFNFLLSPSLSGQSKASEPITKLQQQPMFGASMAIMNIIAIFGLIGGIFQFVKFKSSGESDIYDANNLASKNDKDWNKFLDDAKKDEIDDLDATSKLGPEEQIEDELSKAEETAEKAEENDLTLEEKNIEYAQNVINKIVDAKNNMINAEKSALSIEEKTRVYNTSISYINNALAWLRAAFPKIAAEIEDELKKETIAETAEKSLEIENEKIQAYIDKLRKDKELEIEVKRLDKEIAAKVIPEFDKIANEINIITNAQGEIKKQGKQIINSNTELRNNIKKSQQTIQKIITLLNNSIKNALVNGQTVLDLENDKLQQLKTTVDKELKLYADNKISLIAEIDKFIVHRNELIKKEIQLDKQIVQESRKAIYDVLVEESKKIVSDMNELSNFLNGIKKYMADFKSVNPTQSAQAIKAAKLGIINNIKKQAASMNSTLHFTKDYSNEYTKKIIEDYLSSLIKIADGAEAIEKMERRLPAIERGILKLIDIEQKRANKLKSLEGAK